MKHFTEPEIELIRFVAEDIMETSNNEFPWLTENDTNVIGIVEIK